MAKTKAQKQEEARWRLVRGDLVHEYRNTSDEDLRTGPFGIFHPGCLEREKEGIQARIDKRARLFDEFMGTPVEWRRTALVGWSVPEGLKVKIQQAHLNEVMGHPASASRPRF